MKLVFQNANGHERVIANVATTEEAHAKIKAFCAERDYIIPYMRSYKNADGVRVIDCGSWSEFFKIYPDNKE